jgi:hypothetical protein
MKCSSASLIVALEAERQPVVELAGMVEPVLVEDQGVGERADFQQPMPVGVVSGEPGYLQAEHDPGPAHADLCDQSLESFPVRGAGAGLALVGVDGDDLIGRPTQRDRALPQRVLPGRGLGVVQHLSEAGLPHIQVGGARQVTAGHLQGAGGRGAHQRSPARGQAAQRHRREPLDKAIGASQRCAGASVRRAGRWCGGEAAPGT